jgi:hypothetical protein
MRSGQCKGAQSHSHSKAAVSNGYDDRDYESIAIDVTITLLGLVGTRCSAGAHDHIAKDFALLFYFVSGTGWRHF